MEKRGSAENVVQRTVKLSNGKVEQKNDVKIIDLNELRLPILIDSAVDNYPTEHFTEGVTGRNLNWSYCIKLSLELIYSVQIGVSRFQKFEEFIK